MGMIEKCLILLGDKTNKWVIYHIFKRWYIIISLINCYSNSDKLKKIKIKNTKSKQFVKQILNFQTLWLGVSPGLITSLSSTRVPRFRAHILSIASPLTSKREHWLLFLVFTRNFLSVNSHWIWLFFWHISFSKII